MKQPRHPTEPPQRRWRPLLWVLGASSLVGIWFGANGYAMSASFSVSNPAQEDHWRRMAVIFGLLAVMSLLVLLALLITLVRDRHRAT
jgi:heme/copper-type cytochrome/quinol oxidase subunit 2